MKTTIAQVGAVGLGVIILLLMLVPASFATKDTFGNGVASCNEQANILSTSLFARLNIDHTGSVTGFEIHVSNDDVDCSTMLWSSNAEESGIDLSTGEDSRYDAIALR